MRTVRFTWVIGSLLGLLAASTRQGLALDGYRPSDAVWREDREVRIEWQGTWEATYKANLARWTKEVEQLTRDASARDQRLHLRVVKLLEALLAKYPPNPQQRIDAYQEIAEHYSEARLFGRGFYFLKRSIDEFPGRLDVATDALRRMLHYLTDYGTYVEEETDWAEYASRRFLALQRAGHVLESDPGVLAAQKFLASALRHRGHGMEAAGLIERVEQAAGRNAWVCSELGSLLADAGRGQEALHLLQEARDRFEDARVNERITYLSQELLDNPPTYPNPLNLEARWDAIRDRPVAEVQDRLHDLLREDADGRNVVRLGEGRQCSLWASIDRSLMSQAAALGPLRQEKAAEARSLADSARRSGGSEKLLAVYRRYPWSSVSHQALLAVGEEALRKGHAGLAQRAFRDVLSHAADAAVRAQAQVGLWLAVAQDPDRGELEQAFQGIAPDAAFPWFGRPAPAKTIQERLLASAGHPAAAAPALAKLERRTVRMPPLSPWPAEILDPSAPRDVLAAMSAIPPGLQAQDGDVVVSGPDLVACYGEDLANPRWVRTPRHSTGHDGKYERDDKPPVVVPGIFQPALSDGRAVTRWGMESTRRFMTELAAFDLATGEMAWTTGRDPVWDDLWPVGDPAVADGRAYVLAMQKGHSVSLPVSPIFLVCLEERTGGVLWKRLLASQFVALAAFPGHWQLECAVDLAHYGNAVALRGGEVYCSTNLGFVARCDARDGLIEWTYAYPRIRLAHNMARAVRRLGSPPLVAGGRVILLPRDMQGVFALDRSTGELAWDNPLAPSDGAVGLIDGLLLVHDSAELAALDVSTGRARWSVRFPRGIRGRPLLAGGEVIVATPERLHRIAARTGCGIEEMACDREATMTALAIRGSMLVGLADSAVGQADEPTGKALNPRAPATPAPLRLPLAQSWELRRPDPEIIVPPPEAKVPKRFYLRSRGVIECIRATAQGGIDWQRAVSPGYHLAWAENLILLVYPTRVAALDASTGALRWETELPFRPNRPWRLAPPYLAFGCFGEDHGAQTVCVLDLATGRVVWRRQFRDLKWVYSDALRYIAWDGKAFQLLGQILGMEGETSAVVVAPADGSILDIRPFLPKGQKWPPIVASDAGGGFYVDPTRGAFEFSLDGRTPHKRLAADVREVASDQVHKLQVQLAPPWLRVYQYEYSPYYRHTMWVLQRGNPAYELKRARLGFIQGDTLFERAGPTLAIVDLPSRKEVAYTVAPRLANGARALGVHVEGDTALVVAGLEEGYYGDGRSPACLQVDAFDRATGQRRASQVLRDLPYWKCVTYYLWRDHPVQETQVISDDGVLFVTDAHGLHALTAAASSSSTEPPRETPVRIGYRSPRTVTLDGSLEEWDEASATALRATVGLSDRVEPGTAGQASRGTLLVSHDGTNLYLGVTYSSPSLLPPTPNADNRTPSSPGPRPRRGVGDYGGGDWLELALQGNIESSFRWGAGADERGQLLWESDDPARIPQGIQGRARHDFMRGQLTYEIAIPLKSVLRQDENGAWRSIGLSLTVWKERGGAGSVPLLGAGTGLVGSRTNPLGHETVYLHPLTREGEEAALSVADQLPDLLESQELLEETGRIRSLGTATTPTKDLYRDYLKRHPRGRPALQALLGLDRRLRTGLDSDPTPDVLKLAEQAGVAEPVRQDYARLTKTCLSQWVYLDPKKPGRMVMLALNDGRGDSGWGHAAFWGEDLWPDWGTQNTPSHQYADPLPDTGSWRELRIPLHWIDMLESPIQGILFGQHGDGAVTWDRTAVCATVGLSDRVGPGTAGQASRGTPLDHVFIDDALPEGRPVGNWRWVAEPVKSGTRAHTEGSVGNVNSRFHHQVWQLKTPIIGHIRPPQDGAFLTQWVYIDPAKPTKAVALSLADRGDWRFRAVWGEAVPNGRYMGPLPKAGEWQQLRLPLVWTPFAGRPIHGVSFEQHGGQVFWDRTAILLDGKTTVLIEDEALPGDASGLEWKWVGSPVHSGKKAHTQAIRGDFSGHGVYGLRTLVAAHLSVEPSRMIEVFKAAIPKLGPTDQAWRALELLRQSGFPGSQGWIDVHLWFLKAIPDHPRNGLTLRHLLEGYNEARDKDPIAAVDKIIASVPLPTETVYSYRRNTLPPRDSFIRTWRLLGPFPSPAGNKGRDVAYPPETEGVRLGAEYDGVRGKIRWKPLAAEADAIDLTKVFQPNQHVVAYAACWIYSDKALAASLELGSDDGCKVWLNRKLVLDRVADRLVAPRQEIVPIQLPQGWSELLLKIDQGIRAWGFCVELVSPDGRGLLRELTVVSTPPPDRR